LWLSIGFHTTDGTTDPDGRWIGPVAELKYLVAHEDEQWANARLIAAAPELLDGLSDLNESAERYLAAPSVDAMNGLTAALRFARAAIAKAEGR